MSSAFAQPRKKQAIAITEISPGTVHEDTKEAEEETKKKQELNLKS